MLFIFRKNPNTASFIQIAINQKRPEIMVLATEDDRLQHVKKCIRPTWLNVAREETDRNLNLEVLKKKIYKFYLFIYHFFSNSCFYFLLTIF